MLLLDIVKSGDVVINLSTCKRREEALPLMASGVIAVSERGKSKSIMGWGWGLYMVWEQCWRARRFFALG